MSELLEFLLSSGEQFRRWDMNIATGLYSLTSNRARLPSLWSDFTAQRQTNTNGYLANLSTWEDALSAAAQAGILPGGKAPPECLSLRTGPELLRSLELRDLGRPLALNTVLVCPERAYVAEPKSTSILTRCLRTKQCPKGI